MCVEGVGGGGVCGGVFLGGLALKKVCEET